MRQIDFTTGYSIWLKPAPLDQIEGLLQVLREVGPLGDTEVVQGSSLRRWVDVLHPYLWVNVDAAVLAKLRADMAALGVTLEGNDRTIFILYIVLLSRADLIILSDAVMAWLTQAPQN
jgi:hypothetical protein